MTIGDLVTGDWEFEFRGLKFGGNTDFLIAPGVTGLLDNPDVATADQRRTRRHGLHPGDDYYLSREIVIPIEVTAGTHEQWTANLAALKQACDVDPERGEEPLVFQVPGVAGSGKRRVNARPRGLAVPLDLDYYYEIPIVTVRMVATDPAILDDTLSQATSAPLSATSNGVPWPIGWPLSWGILSATSFPADNSGTRPAEWTATIPGPVTGPRLAHIPTGRALQFDIDLTAGQALIVDSRTRTVLLGGTSNRYSALTADSEWFTLTPGPNDLSYLATAGTGEMTITWRSTWG
jgi:hypothetical protein